MLPRSDLHPVSTRQEFLMPDAAQALFQGLLTVIGRLYWNHTQEEWDQIQNPDIPGMQWSPYDWHDESPESQVPNFVFHDAPAHLNGMEIRWYKHPGRDLTGILTWDYHQWGEWYDACLSHLRQYEASLEYPTRLQRSATQTRLAPMILTMETP